MVATVALQPEAQEANSMNLDPRIDPEKERVTPTKDLKDVYIGSQDFQTTKLGTPLTEIEEEDLIVILRKNIDYSHGPLRTFFGIRPR